MSQVVREDKLEQVLSICLSEVFKEISSLRSELDALRGAMEQFSFKGAWQAGQYKRGSVVSIVAAGIYRALADTAAHPSDSNSWQLLLKAGRDGRDGRDATEPRER